ncbi:unnamed protein product, partial [Mesorhabditis spiculigera]
MPDELSTLADELVRGYLTYRGLATTLNAYEQELKTEKQGKIYVERVVEEITQSIEKHDIDSLKKIWSNFNERTFNQLSGEESRIATQHENDAFKLYIVKCIQKNEKQKCVEFFTKMASMTVGNPTWSEWFAIPYMASDPKDREPFK